ncbi:tetratricopeptide repeat protein 14 [Wyeomyia smithii]|uniref:tetratricopeptide repeat protein 14 n=1 Tax=Wyeomyia smithii TaxID=174621 RepID=UPI0024680FFD|nr:tetratricopeptide repeat protein 14 [Wyeomyia smithii]
MPLHQLDPSLVEKAIGFHGLPLQKIWEGERGETDLSQLGITDPNYDVYQSRQKTLTFHDRAKRFKLHQFLAKKADLLYDSSLTATLAKDRNERRRHGDFQQYEHFFIPPLDIFMDSDANDKITHFLETTRPGDVVYGIVLNRSHQGVLFKVLYSLGNTCCFANSASIKAYVSSNYLVPVTDRNGAPRNFAANDLICCEVTDAQPDSRKLICTMHRTVNSRSPTTINYGLITAEDLPMAYTFAAAKELKSYEYYLRKTPSFNDPRGFECLMQELGLSTTEFYTNMSGLKGKFPQSDYAGELRNSQASKWAFRSVAEGIEHFKEGRHSEAFQCLNKALSIDARNVEGLVARGALYANSGSFKKAVDDFEMALKINSSHANARKYMGETLVALGRSYEEENRIEEARKAYQDCLNIIPHHEEAQNSLEFLKTKTFNKQIVAPNELELPALNIPKSSHDRSKQSNSSNNNKQEPDTSGVSGSKVHDVSESRKDKKSVKKPEKKKRHKKQQSSSSDSSSNSSESSDSSSGSESSSSDSSSTTDSSKSSRAKKRTKRSKADKKLKSLSPLSKRMSAGMGNDTRASDGLFPFGNQSSALGHSSSGADEYEQKVRKFLDMPRDEDDYEEKVRRFVAEAAKYQKERKAQDDKSKKKKKKEEKKVKKESRKKRKSEEKKKSKKKDKDDDVLNNEKLKEALKIFENFPVLDELGSKLSLYYSKKENAAAGPSGISLLSKNLKKEMTKADKVVTIKAPEMAKERPTKDGKWRMMFNKDERSVKEPTVVKVAVPKQYAFPNESDDEGGTLGVFQMQQHQQQLQQKANARTGRYEEKTRRVVITTEKQKPSVSQMAPVKSGPVVLDKFGNFRLANADDAVKPPEPSGPPRQSRSRSRGRRYGSSSRSRSQSGGKRSRSGSFRRRFSRSRSRSFSRSRSRSYSRSRSRSRSFERRRFDRRGYHHRGRGNFYDRPYNRFGYHHRGNFMNRRGGFRDFRDYNNRGYGRPFRARFRGGGNNHNYRFQRSYSHSRSDSKSPDRVTSPSDRQRDRSRSRDDDKRSEDSPIIIKERDTPPKSKAKKDDKPSVDSEPSTTSTGHDADNWGDDRDPPPPGADEGILMKNLGD